MADLAALDQQVPDLPVPDLAVPDQQVPDLPLPDLPVPDQQVPDLPPPDAGGCVHPVVAQSCTNGFCKILPGCFTMGSPASEPCRWTNEDLHQVTLTHTFFVAQTETTQQQFNNAMGYNPSYLQGCAACPVENLNWHEAAAYCNALSVGAGLTPCLSCTGSKALTRCTVKAAYAGQKIYTCPGYRLPTEAEFEYAVRAGTTTSHYGGHLAAVECNKGDAKLDAIAWYKHNTMQIVQPVAGKQANGWGLHDMSGNVDEWSIDGYVEHLGSAPPVNPSNTFFPPAVRGGSVILGARDQRSAARGGVADTDWGYNLGFRCVRSVP